MDFLYLAIIIILLLFAILDLFVGVSNDAVNFLNSAIGSKAAPKKVIFTVATIGILIGVMTSSGMMEIARNGVFHPEMFTFKNIMMLFLAVVLTDVILLDLFNTFGLPTSTTVSLVFELLGASVCIALFVIGRDPALEFDDIDRFLNGGKALGIISGILISVVVAFITGSVVMYITRLLFTFNYSKKIRSVGSLWCGISFTATTYFILFKGLKGTNLIGDGIYQFVNEHTWLILSGMCVFWTIVMFILSSLKVKILNISVLAGTFGLALAFAGNDLVNFIGVSIAGYDSYNIALASPDGVNTMMGALTRPVKAELYMLAIAGSVMALTIWLSKKSQTVSDTEVNLARQDEGVERFGSTSVSRAIVRFAMNVNSAVKFALPKRVLAEINRRFQRPTPSKEGGADTTESASFDILRASVNLTMASLLIAFATSLKLPLSTTYVTFMVAMGSSLADRAWGRESAVYRITGVLTVILGWFITALIAFVIAFCVAAVLMAGGTVAIVLMVALAGYLMYRSLFRKKKKSEQLALAKTLKGSTLSPVETCSKGISESIVQLESVYLQALEGAYKEDRKLLGETMRKASQIYHSASDLKHNVMDMLMVFSKNNIETGHYYVQVVDYLDEVTKSMYHIAKSSYDHINNQHRGLSVDQVKDLEAVDMRMAAVFRKVVSMLEKKDFSGIDEIIALGDAVFEEIAQASKSQIVRNKGNINTVHSSALYFNIIGEVKMIVLQLRNLLKALKAFLEG